MPTIEDVDTTVGESLSCLPKPEYKIEREQWGKNIHYTIYKKGKVLGTYRIKPGEPGGSIQGPETPELEEEWGNIVSELIWPDLERQFGEFSTWSESTTLPGISEAAELFIRTSALNTTGVVINEKDLPKSKDEIIKQVKEAKRFRKLRGVEEIEEKPSKVRREAKPWEEINDSLWDRVALQMWWEGHNNKEIGKQVSVSSLRVTNRISELRRQYGDKIVPYHKDRIRYLRKKNS